VPNVPEVPEVLEVPELLAEVVGATTASVAVDVSDEVGLPVALTDSSMSVLTGALEVVGTVASSSTMSPADTVPMVHVEPLTDGQMENPGLPR
jgi:hypothetical protein